jgi:hypothetical protein
MLKIFLTLILAAALGTAAVAGSFLSVILANPGEYDGKHVTVSGYVRNLAEKTSRKGNPYTTFSLCESQCMRVFTFGRPHITEGQKRLTVSGTFSAVKRVGSYTFHNELEADEGTL